MAVLTLLVLKYFEHEIFVIFVTSVKKFLGKSFLVKVSQVTFNSRQVVTADPHAQ